MLATTIQITNNPPHTTHTQEQTLRLAARATTTTKDGGRSHGVEREPDSVLARITSYAQPKHAPTPTTHSQEVNTCEHKKTTNTPTTCERTDCFPQIWAP